MAKKYYLTKSQKALINILRENGNLTFDELYKLTKSREETRLKDTLYILLRENLIEYQTIRPTSSTLIYRLKENYESL